MYNYKIPLDLRIWLDKNTYEASETAKGTLIIRANSSLKVRKLKFSVYGKERYGAYGLWKRWVEKYDIFLFEDLSSFLKSIKVSSHNHDSVEIPQGSFAIPFHFSIPNNSLESYRGKNARIVYEVEIHADIGWKEDYHKVKILLY